MNTLKIKLDENLERVHAEFLRQSGYPTERVYEQGLSGRSDREIWEKVCAEGYLFITLDQDFADIRRFSPGIRVGLVLLRPRFHSRQAVLHILERLVRQFPLESLMGCLVVVDEMRTRIRRLS